MNQEDLSFFKRLIIDEIHRISEDIENLEDRSKKDGAEKFDHRSTYSIHMADHGTDAIEREKSLMFAQRGTNYLDNLTEAIQRIDSRTYGFCFKCGEKINPSRLEALLTATQCIDCIEKSDNTLL